MRLKTLGGLALEGSDFQQPLPLLLLGYLALEGPQTRRYLAELFWSDAKDPRDSLSTTVRRLGRVGVDIDRDHVRVSSNAACDVVELLSLLDAGEDAKAIALYRGSFLEGLPLTLGEELEDWVYATREHVARRVRAALLQVGEKEAGRGELGSAGLLAERAYLLRGAPEPDAEEYQRLYILLHLGGSPRAAEVRNEAEGFGIPLDDPTTERVRGSLVRTDGLQPSALHNLPAPATRFVGRASEIGAVADRLGDPACRLVTVVAPGGMGKTRLAIASAERQLGNYQDGVWFVNLVPVTTPEQIASAVGEALSLPFLGSGEPQEQLLNYVSSKELLLVLDNFEHLQPGVKLVTQILDTARQVKVLATSREPLNLQAEHVFDLTGLPVPEDGAGAGVKEAGAVTLFLQSAHRRRSDFVLDEPAHVTIRRICRLVEGMPLAIELAAQWLRSLTPEDIAAEIEQGIDFLESSAHDLPVRHRSVRAVFDSSWALLTDAERTALRRLAVFRGSFRREAATEMAGVRLPVLASLVDKSFLSATPEGRYRRHPLVIQYCQEKLAEHPEDLEEFRRRHGLYYLRFVRERTPEVRTTNRVDAFRAIGEELANIRAAWGWAVTNQQIEELNETILPLSLTYEDRGRIAEAAELFARAAATLNEEDPEHRSALGRALSEQARVVLVHDKERGRNLLRRGLELLKGAPDDLGLAYALRTQGWISWLDEGNLVEGGEVFRECLALARKVGDRFLISFSIVMLVCIEAELKGSDRESIQESRRLFEGALAEVRELGDQPNLARGIVGFGLYLSRNWILEEGQAQLEESLRLARDLHILDTVEMAVGHLAEATFRSGKYDEAETYALELLGLGERFDEPAAKAGALTFLGRVKTAQGDLDQARTLLKKAMLGNKRFGYIYDIFQSLLGCAELLIAREEPRAAAAWLVFALQHPTIEKHNEEEARRMLGALGDRLTREELADARKRGSTLDLDDVVREILTALS